MFVLVRFVPHSSSKVQVFGWWRNGKACIYRVGKHLRSTESPIRTVPEAAQYLRVPNSWIYTHLDQIPHFRVGKYVRFRQADLEQAVSGLMRTPGAR